MDELDSSITFDLKGDITKRTFCLHDDDGGPDRQGFGETLRHCIENSFGRGEVLKLLAHSVAEADIEPGSLAAASTAFRSAARAMIDAINEQRR